VQSDRRRDTERWFVRRGVPHFIQDYSAATDIFTRAAPFLTFIFLIEVFAALNFEAWWANTLAVIGAFGLIVGVWAQINRWRGRPALQRPSSIGSVELSAFILVPPIIPVVFGGNLLGSAGLIATNLGIVVLVFVATSYGLVPIIIWATGRLFRQLGETLLLFARAIPLLLLFVTFLFINAEVWQVSARLLGPLFGGTIGLFALFGALFIVVRLPAEVRGLGSFAGWEEVQELCSQTPMDGAVVGLSGQPEEPQLSRTEWANTGLVVLFGQALQVFLVALLVGAFLVLLGLLTMPTEVVESWTQMPARPIGPALSLLGREVVLTEELLRVASFLGAFSGLYFAVTAVTDPSYREEFFTDVVSDVRQAFAVRAAYRAVID
jgi:hypothetical protein